MNKPNLAENSSFRPPLLRFSRALRVAILAACAIGFAGAQSAARPTANLDSLLEILLAKGILTQQEYDTLKQRMVKPAPAPQPEPAQEKAAEALAKPTPSSRSVTMMDSAVGIHLGPVDVSISGEVNAFYDHDRPNKGAQVVAGGLLRNCLLEGGNLETQRFGFSH